MLQEHSSYFQAPILPSALSNFGILQKKLKNNSSVGLLDYKNFN